MGWFRRSPAVLVAGLLCVTLTAGLATPAVAAPAAQGGARQVTVWQELHREIEQWIERSGAREGLIALGTSLYVFLGMVQAYSAVIGTSASGVADSVFRVIMAGFLISLVKNGTIADILGMAYRAFSDFGISIFWRSRDAIAGDLTAPFNRLRDGIGEFVRALASGIAGWAAAIVLGMVTTGVIALVIVSILLFSGMYIVVNLIALIMLSLALLVAPLSFAAFAYRGTSEWTWRWVSAVVNPLVTVLLANLVSAAVFWMIVKGPEHLFGAIFAGPVGGMSPVGQFFGQMMGPLLFLVLAPVFGSLMLMRIETVVAHFTAGFGNLTAAAEQLLTLRWLTPTLRRSRPISESARPSVPGQGGPAGTVGTTGGPAPGAGRIPPPPTAPTPPVATVRLQPAPPSEASAVARSAGESGYSGAVPVYFHPRPAAPSPGLPASEESALRNWSEHHFGFGVAPWLWNPDSAVPTYAMTAEQVVRVYGAELGQRGFRVKEVSQSGDTGTVVFEAQDGRKVRFTAEIRRPDARAGRETELRVDMQRPGEDRWNEMFRATVTQHVFSFEPRGGYADAVVSGQTPAPPVQNIGLRS